MQHSPSWEANSSSVGQEIPRISWNPKVHLPHSQQLANCPYPEPQQSSPLPLPIFWRSILKLASNQHLGISSGLFSLRSFHQNHVSTSADFHTCYMSHPSHVVGSKYYIRVLRKNYVKQTHWNGIKITRNKPHNYVRIRWEVSRTAVLVSGSNTFGCPNNIVTTVVVTGAVRSLSVQTLCARHPKTFRRYEIF